MTQIKIYNTKTRTKEIFAPIKEGVLKIYSCGPTVYSTQHIGNLRAALVWDFVKRTFRYFGYQVEDVMNITDVGHLTSDADDGEDKFEKAIKKENKHPLEIAKYYENIYLNDIDKINVIKPKYIPRASEEIKEQIDIIKSLEKNGYTYTTQDGVYFDTSKFKDYGKLSGQHLEEKKKDARVTNKDTKRNYQDFALWIFCVGEHKNHTLRWESPWGVGFPGWHIECSAMGYKYLGNMIDIHTGGIEHIPIHHENEIAQNQCSENSIDVINYWMHNEHLLVNNEKMSKSLGNVYILDDLIEKGYHPLAFREMTLKTHYRKSMNFTFDGLLASQKNVDKINNFYNKLRLIKFDIADNQLEIIYDMLIKKFNEALSDDFNTAEALASLYEFMNEFNKFEKYSEKDVMFAKKFFDNTNSVLGLLFTELEEIPLEVIELAKERAKARENKDFIKSDEIRDEIKHLGYEINDSKETKNGFIITSLKNR